MVGKILIAAGLAGMTALALRRLFRQSEISSKQLANWMDNEEAFLLLDVRSEEEYSGGHIPGARLISHEQVVSSPEEVEAADDQPIVVYCERGFRAKKAQSALIAAGKHEVYHLSGDMAAWRSRGLPTET